MTHINLMLIDWCIYCCTKPVEHCDQQAVTHIISLTYIEYTRITPKYKKNQNITKIESTNH